MLGFFYCLTFFFVLFSQSTVTYTLKWSILNIGLFALLPRTLRVREFGVINCLGLLYRTPTWHLARVTRKQIVLKRISYVMHKGIFFVYKQAYDQK